ncbi:hypothetical protein Drorol1_Dr00008097 [Drosera rotundifolia]
MATTMARRMWRRKGILSVHLPSSPRSTFTRTTILNLTPPHNHQATTLPSPTTKVVAPECDSGNFCFDCGLLGSGAAGSAVRPARTAVMAQRGRLRLGSGTRRLYIWMGGDASGERAEMAVWRRLQLRHLGRVVAAPCRSRTTRLGLLTWVAAMMNPTVRVGTAAWSDGTGSDGNGFWEVMVSRPVDVVDEYSFWVQCVLGCLTPG